MKNFLKLSALAAVLVASATYASADTIQLGSFATGGATLGNQNTAMNYAGVLELGVPTASQVAPAFGTLPSGTGSTYFLDPNGVWQAAFSNSTWIGVAPTAGPYGTNPAYGFYTFTSTFTAVDAATEAYSGNFSVMADDTVAVYLNGNLLLTYGALGGDLKCADNPPTCHTDPGNTVSLSGIGLKSGVGANVLTFEVQQAGDQTPKADPSGLDFSSTLVGSPVPEPSTLLMLGTGLMGSAGALFRRMRS